MDRHRVEGAKVEALHKCAVVPRRARISGSSTFRSLNTRLESNNEEDSYQTFELIEAFDNQPVFPPATLTVFQAHGLL